MTISPDNARQVVQDAIELEKLEPQPSVRSVTVTEPAPAAPITVAGFGDASISTKGLLLLSSLHLSS
jgi:hypothetical protein